MHARTIGITGTGYYLPSKVVTNKDLEKTIDTTDEWIFSKVGVKERRIASSQEATSDLALYAAQSRSHSTGDFQPRYDPASHRINCAG